MGWRAGGRVGKVIVPVLPVDSYASDNASANASAIAAANASVEVSTIASARCVHFHFFRSGGSSSETSGESPSSRHSGGGVAKR